MSSPVRGIGDDEHLFIAIARMRRLGHRHMPVVDADGALAGLIGLDDSVAVAASQTLDQIDGLAIMTDCDNSGQTVTGWYGTIEWLPATSGATGR